MNNEISISNISMSVVNVLRTLNFGQLKKILGQYKDMKVYNANNVQCLKL